MTERPQLQVFIANLPPEGRPVAGEVRFSTLDIRDDDCIACPNPLRYSLHVAPVGQQLLVRGRLETVLRCRCDRCLGSYDLPLATDDVCHLFEDVGDDVVDLTEYVREDILLVFPLRHLCDDKCRGLCPTCGQNLNAETCSCSQEGTSEGIWGALDCLPLPPTAEE